MAALIGAPALSYSMPVTYIVNDPFAGVGTFIIDIGAPLGECFATSLQVAAGDSTRHGPKSSS